jgi:hypothetical protein
LETLIQMKKNTSDLRHECVEYLWGGVFAEAVLENLAEILRNAIDLTTHDQRASQQSAGG